MTTVNWNGAHEQWDLVEKCIAYAFTTFIEGAPGLGKTFSGLKGSGMNLPTYQITFNPDASVQEYQGTYIPTESGAWVWRDGPILQAFRNGGLLVMNEMGRASDAVLDFLLAITDSKESAKITLMNGESVNRHPTLRIVATSNSPFSKLPEALQDRFEARLRVTVPHPNILADLNGKMRGLGDLVRRSYGDGEKEPQMTTREAFAYASLSSKIGVEAAARAVWGNKNPELATEVLMALEMTTK